MIRAFHITDLNKFTPNEFSNCSEFKYVFEDEAYYKYTMEVEGKIKSIICFKNTEAKVYAAFFLISKDFTMKDGVLLKAFMLECIEVFKPTRVWTASRDHEKITRWHKFLDMSTERSLEIDGVKYNIWSLVYGN